MSAAAGSVPPSPLGPRGAAPRGAALLRAAALPVVLLLVWQVWALTLPAAGLVGAGAALLADQGNWGVAAVAVLGLAVCAAIRGAARRRPVTHANVNDEIGGIGDGEQAVGLINDLLDLSRLDEDRLKPVIRAVEPGAVAKRAAGRVTPAAQARQVSLRVHLAPALPGIQVASSFTSTRRR